VLPYDITSHAVSADDDWLIGSKPNGETRQVAGRKTRVSGNGTEVKVRLACRKGPH